MSVCASIFHVGHVCLSACASIFHVGASLKRASKRSKSRGHMSYHTIIPNKHHFFLERLSTNSLTRLESLPSPFSVTVNMGPQKLVHKFFFCYFSPNFMFFLFKPAQRSGSIGLVYIKHPPHRHAW